MHLKHSQILLVSVTFLLLVIGSFTLQVSAGVVWSDDFNDQNYDGWTILEGAFTISDSPKYSLTADFVGNSMIYYPSAQFNGEWIFELYEDGTEEDAIEILFMATGSTLEDFEGYSLYLTYSEVDYDVEFCRWNYSSTYERSARWILDSFDIWISTETLPDPGWHWYNISRDLTGNFTVSRDNEVIITTSPELEEYEFTSPNYDSDKFVVRAEEGASIDTIITGIDLPATITESTTGSDTTTSTPSETTTTSSGPDPGFNFGPENIFFGITTACIVLVVIVVLIQKRK